jgi:hypothetical protein
MLGENHQLDSDAVITIASSRSPRTAKLPITLDKLGVALPSMRSRARRCRRMPTAQRAGVSVSGTLRASNRSVRLKSLSHAYMVKVIREVKSGVAYRRPTVAAGFQS